MANDGEHALDVVRNSERGGWEVRWNGADDGLLYETRSEALAAAQDIAREYSEVAEPSRIVFISDFGERLVGYSPVATATTDTSASRDRPRRLYRLRLYVQTPDPVVAVRAVLGFLDLARALGYGPVHVLEVSDGSVWTDFAAKVRKGWDDRRTKRAANLARQSLEAWGIDRPMANNTRKVMEGAANFLAAVSDADTVSADFGNVVIAQIRDPDGKKHIRAIAHNARDIASQRYPDELLRDPMQLFQQLPASEAADENPV